MTLPLIAADDQVHSVFPSRGIPNSPPQKVFLVQSELIPVLEKGSDELKELAESSKLYTEAEIKAGEARGKPRVKVTTYEALMALGD